MPKIRVMVVDDAVVVRRLVTDALSTDPQIEVVGVAPNGKIALQKIPQLNPDVITMDVEMPEMNGLETIREIRKLYKKLPVIMFSTLTERGAAATLEALAGGASDYVTKPANVGSVAAGIARVRDQLIPKIKTLAGVPAEPPMVPPGVGPRGGVSAPTAGARAGASPAAPAPSGNGLSVSGAGWPRITGTVQRKAPLTNVIEMVAIGVSTGGPNALAEVIPMIPRDFPVPIVIVQHMPPVFTKMLAERLSTKSQIKVVEGEEGMQLRPGFAYIAPGDYHMITHRVAGGWQLQLNKNASENSCRPAVDVLFRSVVDCVGGKCLGVILTGMGADGLRGSQLIYEQGGRVFAQDEATSVVWGMPGFVARAGLAEKILPLQQVAPEICRAVSSQRGVAGSAGQRMVG